MYDIRVLQNFIRLLVRIYHRKRETYPLWFSYTSAYRYRTFCSLKSSPACIKPSNFTDAFVTVLEGRILDGLASSVASSLVSVITSASSSSLFLLELALRGERGRECRFQPRVCLLAKLSSTSWAVSSSRTAGGGGLKGGIAVSAPGGVSVMLRVRLGQLLTIPDVARSKVELGSGPLRNGQKRKA